MFFSTVCHAKTGTLVYDCGPSCSKALESYSFQKQMNKRLFCFNPPRWRQLMMRWNRWSWRTVHLLTHGGVNSPLNVCFSEVFYRLFGGSPLTPPPPPPPPHRVRAGTWAELRGDDGAMKVEAPLGCRALGAPCAVGDAVKKKKEACATHTAGMSCMQSIESVSSGGEGGLFRRARVHGGSVLEVGSARLKKMKHKTHFPSSSSSPSSKNTLLH